MVMFDSYERDMIRKVIDKTQLSNEMLYQLLRINGGTPENIMADFNERLDA